MLPEIEGAKFPNFPWNSFVFERVLEYYDGPRLLLQRSQAGQLYLAWWNDADESIDRWIYLPVSEQRLREILSGSVSALDALSNPEDGNLLVVDIDVGIDSVIQAIVTTAGSLPQDSLPLEWSKLDIPMPEEINGAPTRERSHLLDLRIEGQVGQVAADVASRLVGNLQRLLDAIGQALSAAPTSKGPIPNSIKEQTRLNFAGTYASSLGLRLEAHRQDSPLGESLARSSLEGLFGLLEEDQRTSEPAFQRRIWTSRVIANYINFLSAIESSSYPASLRWNQRGKDETHEVRITPGSAESMKSTIRAATDEIQEDLYLEGVIVAGNIRTKWFQFTATGSGDNFSGRIHRDATSQVDHIPLGSACLVILKPNLQINQLTGEEKTTYTLHSIRPM